MLMVLAAPVARMATVRLDNVCGTVLFHFAPLDCMLSMIAAQLSKR